MEEENNVLIEYETPEPEYNPKTGKKIRKRKKEKITTKDFNNMPGFLIGALH